MKFVFMFLALFLLMGCETDEADRLCFHGDYCEEEPYYPDYCQYGYEKVCGYDGVTYDQCDLEYGYLDYEDVAYWGSCKEKECPDVDYNCDGYLYCYWNQKNCETCICYENPTGCNPQYPTACSEEEFCNPDGICIPKEIPECDCPATEEPVCGIDGETYQNSCFATCKDVAIKATGKCETVDPCSLCDQNERPVCGEDGNTYINECLATCKEITVKYNSSCIDGACTTDSDCIDTRVCVKEHDDQSATGTCKEVTDTEGCSGNNECPANSYCVTPINNCSCDLNGCSCPDSGVCTPLAEGCFKDTDCPEGRVCILPLNCSCDDNGCFCDSPGRCMPKQPEVCIADTDCPENYSCIEVNGCYLNDQGVIDCNGFGYCQPNAENGGK